MTNATMDAEKQWCSSNLKQDYVVCYDTLRLAVYLRYCFSMVVSLWLAIAVVSEEMLLLTDNARCPFNVRHRS